MSMFPAGVRVDLLDLESGHGHARRIRAVRGVRDDDLRPLLAPVGEVGAHQHQAGQLALAAGGGLKADGIEPRQLAQDLLKLPLELERALDPVLLLERVEVAEAGEPDDPLVDARVVLHRARAERVEARVDPEVPRRELA